MPVISHCFHVRVNVAPLKPGRRYAPAEIMEFPRSSERGSIEALLRTAANAAIGAFPRSSERGSIEAMRVRFLCGPMVLFPRSSERGSIEARLS